MSKGSKPRPLSVSRRQYGANYDRIFGKKKFNVRSSGSKETMGPETEQRRTELEPKRYDFRVGYNYQAYQEGYERVFGKQTND